MAERHKDAKKYNDFRELLHELDSRIDAVVVSTPDHTHAPAAVTAMRLGKHVYCQKPLTHSVWEARLMRETARQKGVCTQMGNQGTADPGFRRGAELVRAGAIGEVREVHVWTNRPFNYWKQAPDIVARPKETRPVPAHVHWDLFLGPAPERPYNPVYHPHNWRGWWDFGTGSLGRHGLPHGEPGLHGARARSSRAGIGRERRDQPRDLSGLGDDHLRVPGPRQPAPGQAHLVRRARRTASATCRRPDSFPTEASSPPTAARSWSARSGGCIRPTTMGRSRCSGPRAITRTSRFPSPRLPRVAGARDIDDAQKREWVQAIRAGKPAIALSNFDYASTLTESMLLGNVAVRSGQAIDYNPDTGEITGSSSASAVPQAVLPQGVGDLR